MTLEAGISSNFEKPTQNRNLLDIENQRGKITEIKGWRV